MLRLTDAPFIHLLIPPVKGVKIPLTEDEKFIDDHFKVMKNVCVGDKEVEFATYTIGPWGLQMLPASEIIKHGIAPDYQFMKLDKGISDDLIVSEKGEKAKQIWARIEKELLTLNQTLDQVAIQQKISEVCMRAHIEVYGTYAQNISHTNQKEAKVAQEGRSPTLEEFEKNELVCRQDAIAVAFTMQRAQAFITEENKRVNYYSAENIAVDAAGRVGKHAFVINSLGHVIEATLSEPEKAYLIPEEGFSLKGFVTGTALFKDCDGVKYSAANTGTLAEHAVVQQRIAGINTTLPDLPENGDVKAYNTFYAKATAKAYTLEVDRAENLRDIEEKRDYLSAVNPAFKIRENYSKVFDAYTEIFTRSTDAFELYAQAKEYRTTVGNPYDLNTISATYADLKQMYDGAIVSTETRNRIADQIKNVEQTLSGPVISQTISGIEHNNFFGTKEYTAALKRLDGQLSGFYHSTATEKEFLEALGHYSQALRAIKDSDNPSALEKHIKRLEAISSGAVQTKEEVYTAKDAPKKLQKDVLFNHEYSQAPELLITNMQKMSREYAGLFNSAEHKDRHTVELDLCRELITLNAKGHYNQAAKLLHTYDYPFQQSALHFRVEESVGYMVQQASIQLALYKALDADKNGSISESEISKLKEKEEFMKILNDVPLPEFDKVFINKNDAALNVILKKNGFYTVVPLKPDIKNPPSHGKRELN